MTTLAPDAAGLGGTWNWNDVILYATRQGPLYRVSASGGAAEAVTVLNNDTHSDPVFLSDGRHFLYEVTDLAQRGRGGIYVGDLQKQELPKGCSQSTPMPSSPTGISFLLATGR